MTDATQESPATGPAPMIPNYLWQSIVVTLLCCWPLGIPAIVFAAKVNSQLVQGDRDAAMESSRKAKMWCWIAFGSGLAFWIIYLLFFGGLAFMGAMAGNQ